MNQLELSYAQRESQSLQDQIPTHKNRHHFFPVIFCCCNFINLYFRLGSSSSIPVLQLLQSRFPTQLQQVTTHKLELETQIASYSAQINALLADNASLSAQISKLQNRDEFKINQALEEELMLINQTYKLAVDTYENLFRLKEEGKDTQQLEIELAKGLVELSDRNYQSAKDKLNHINSEVDKVFDEIQKQLAEEQAKLQAQANANSPSISVNNTPPGTGYSRQYVTSSRGTFLVDLVAADLASTRVIVDTASSGDCHNECPVTSLADYVSRNGAYAGINGSYFCPASYPSCVGKSNSFDTLLMNKNKVYFNSDNNIYSTNPAVIFGNGWFASFQKL